jgi:hypothetical protein
MASLRLTGVLGTFNRINKHIVLSQKSKFQILIKNCYNFSLILTQSLNFGLDCYFHFFKHNLFSLKASLSECKRYLASLPSAATQKHIKTSIKDDVLIISLDSPGAKVNSLGVSFFSKYIKLSFFT